MTFKIALQDYFGNMIILVIDEMSEDYQNSFSELVK